MQTWLPISADSDFSIHNLPYGIFDPSDAHGARVGVAIGDQIIDLEAAAKTGIFSKIRFDKKVFRQPKLNDFIRLGKKVTSRVRLAIQTDLCDKNGFLVKNKDKIFHNRLTAKLLLPIEIGDYTDFYSSEDHARNVGIMFRDPKNALLPNWKWMPVGYHGRASSIVVSGTDLHRPMGQIVPKGAEIPVFAASKQVDFELEMGFIIGKDSTLGESISTKKSEEYIFGMVLFNDWSARDIQKWEYVPLGPFLGKNFGSSMSPWVVPMEALEPFRVKGPVQKPKPLSYLTASKSMNYDINLEVSIGINDTETQVVSQSNYKFMYWNMAQQLAHHTINGCNVRVGDLMASGTISGPTEGSFGSMLEIAWAGTKPVLMPDGSTRTFILDNDRVTMRGWAEKNGVRVGFGAVTSVLKSANLK
jgi:fumarylacetoacetase